MAVRTNSITREIATIADLESNADCILYGYGSAGGRQHQESPPYMLELASRNPRKNYEMIHCDGSFFNNIELSRHPDPKLRNLPGRMPPHCLNSPDWIAERLPVEIRARHTRFSNLTIRLINKLLPRDVSNAFTDQFFKFLEKKLSRSVEIFLASHASSWYDQGVFGHVFNLLYKMNPNIHFYVQAGATFPVLVYKGPYLDAFGYFAMNAFWSHSPDGQVKEPFKWLCCAIPASAA